MLSYIIESWFGISLSEVQTFFANEKKKKKKRSSYYHNIEETDSVSRQLKHIYALERRHAYKR